MDEHKKFLADRLLSEERPITYRLLSRALDVHVNTAKEMLYDFHQYQNAQRADSVHATYLVYGNKTDGHAQTNGDVEMSSSMPEHESLSEDAPTTTLTLVGEEKLEGTLATYQEVTSIHVYSLAPHPQRDLTLLATVSKSLAEYTTNEDASAACKKYGTIYNPDVRVRSRRTRPKEPATTSTKAPVKKEPPPATTSQAAKVKQLVAETTSKDTTPTSSAGKNAVPSLKRAGSSGIMQSFAKAASRPAKAKPAPKKEEESRALSDDGEADDADIGQTKKKKESTDAEAVRKSRKEREEELRRMMEEDDEDNEEEGEKQENDPDEEMEEAPEPEAEPEATTETNKDEEPAEVVSGTADGRRRGKRRVMNKKRIKDDEGYMVTIQEPGWESFSEDDAPPAKKTASSMPSIPVSSTSSAAKAKKPAGKVGQGNIMSFFSKK